MPTHKPRVTVTLNPSTYEVITELARLQKRSPGQVIMEFLEVVEDPLRRLTAILQAAEEGPAHIKLMLAGTLAQQMREVDTLFGSAMDALFDAEGSESPELSTKPTPIPVIRGSGIGNPLKTGKTGKGSKS